MKRPDSVRILGVDIPITASTPSRDSQLDTKLGYADHCRSLIVVNEQYQDTPEGPETLLHEVIHSLDHAMRLDFSEDTVGRLSRGLWAVMHDNRQLVEYLMNPE